MDGFFTRKRDRKHVTNTRIIYGITFPDPHSSYERPVITQFHVERGDYIRDPKAYFNNIAAQNGYSMQEIDECWNGNGVHVQLSELFNQQSSHIELGVDHIRHLVESRADGGLAYLWDLCQRDPDLTPSNECGPMLKWLLAPVLARGLESLNQVLSRKTQPQTNRPILGFGGRDDKESFEIRHRPTTSEPAEEDSPLNAKLGSESAITAYGRVFDLEYDDDVGSGIDHDFDSRKPPNTR
ncbi:unnamed protein product [Fusarium fujikuroi]|nr:unnamed protein product [Fusarium fujikuroi]